METSVEISDAEMLVTMTCSNKIYRKNPYSISFDSAEGVAG